MRHPRTGRSVAALSVAASIAVSACGAASGTPAQQTPGALAARVVFTASADRPHTRLIGRDGSLLLIDAGETGAAGAPSARDVFTIDLAASGARHSVVINGGAAFLPVAAGGGRVAGMAGDGSAGNCSPFYAPIAGGASVRPGLLPGDTCGVVEVAGAQRLAGISESVDADGLLHARPVLFDPATGSAAALPRPDGATDGGVRAIAGDWAAGEYYDSANVIHGIIWSLGTGGYAVFGLSPASGDITRYAFLDGSRLLVAYTLSGRTGTDSFAIIDLASGKESPKPAIGSGEAVLGGGGSLLLLGQVSPDRSIGQITVLDTASGLRTQLQMPAAPPAAAAGASPVPSVSMLNAVVSGRVLVIERYWFSFGGPARATEVLEAVLPG